MNKEFFNKQVNRLVIEYSDKGFNMSKERALQWYEILKKYREDSFDIAVTEVLHTVSYAPTIADIFKAGKLVEDRASMKIIKKPEQ